MTKQTFYFSNDQEPKAVATHLRQWLGPKYRKVIRRIVAKGTHLTLYYWLYDPVLAERTSERIAGFLVGWEARGEL